MKKFSAILIVAICAAVLVAGCSKDNQRAKQLDGTWTVSTLSVDGENILEDDFTIKFSFTQCKTTKEWCSGSMTQDFGDETDTEMFEWQLSDKGEKMTRRDDANETEENYDVWTITSFSKTEVSFTWTEDDGSYAATMKKD